MSKAASKIELYQQYHDEWMIRFKRYQTSEDFKIELASQSTRQRNYFIGATTAFSLWVYTQAPAAVNRRFSEPHFFDAGIDARAKEFCRSALNGTRRYTPNGWMRWVTIGLPTYVAVATLEHSNAKTRWNAYLEADTVFGEQARRMQKNGLDTPLEEYLAVNIKATLPEADAKVYA